MRRHLQTRRRRPLLSVLVPLVLLTLLGGVTGCGSDEGGGGSGGQPDPTGSTGPEPGVGADVRVVEIVTASPGSGGVDREPVELAPEDHVGELVAGLDTGLAEDVRRAAERAAADPEVRQHVADGGRLMGAVVWLGCETPRRVAVTGEGDQLRVRAVVKSTGDVQCLVPTTTVALFTV